MRKVLSILAIVLISSAACNFVFLEDNLQQTAKCPAFTCNTSNGADGLCFTGTGAVPTGDRKTTMYSCKDTQQCSVVDFFNFALDVKCTDLPTPGPKPTLNMLPGEACTEEKDCKPVTLVANDSDTETTLGGKCVDKKCIGNDPTKKCVDHSSCTVGHYCAGFDTEAKKRGTCKPYEKVGGDCKSKSDCSFGLVCYKQKCHNGDLALGTEVDPQDMEACATSYAAQDGDKKWRCAITVYDSAKHTTLVNNEVVECDFNSDCYYANRFSDATDKDVKIADTQKCQCSFSGKGYCPFAAFSTKSRAEKVAKGHANVMAKENVHHNNNRDNEFLLTTDDIKYSSSCVGYYMSPRSYGSPSACTTATNTWRHCTYMSSSFIKFSFVLLGLILALF